MTTPTDDRGDNEYLWDRSGPADPAVADLERRLAPLAFDPTPRPRLRPRARWRAIVLVGTIAASLALAVGFGYYRWRLAWPANRAWTMVVTEPGPSAPVTPGQLGVGEPLAVPSPASAHIDVARLGTIDATPGTELTISATESQRHRVEMTRGSVDVRLWAPPFTVAIRTPSGDVIDLGCRFTLTVDPQGVAFLTVRTGWVELDNAFGESLVPAGASSAMQADRQPFVPVYDDAAPEFLNAVRAFERAGGDAAAASLPSIIMAKVVRPRDVLTLLVLATRQHGSARAGLVAAAASLDPPPAGVSLDAINRGDNPSLWKWIDSLALPPVKDWWRNWRDALPRQ
ncbi:MAG TPA: hypothetical protein VLT86_04535 [Vicinamibacterales bacterium]|nr:hypothetical protein [Vicinamibacterales bacterium]